MSELERLLGLEITDDIYFVGKDDRKALEVRKKTISELDQEERSAFQKLTEFYEEGKIDIKKLTLMRKELQLKYQQLKNKALERIEKVQEQDEKMIDDYFNEVKEQVERDVDSGELFKEKVENEEVERRVW